MTTQYQLATSLKKDELWQQLATKTILEAAQSFLDTLNPHTKRSYRCSFNKIFELLNDKNLLSPSMTLQTFSMCNMENLLDCIRANLIGSESTKQHRAAAFIALTNYLARKTQGMIKSAVPVKGGRNATFRKVRDKADTEALTHEEYIRFINALKIISFRDYLIAKAIMQGAKRVSEVLSAKIGQIDWSKNLITYKQSKASEIERFTKIYYTDQFMDELRHYLYDRTEGHIFLSRNHRPISQPHIYRVFRYAAVQAGLTKKVHPHMLRSTCITLLMKMGYHSDDIMRVSGHVSPISVIYYDKRPDEENISQRVRFA